MYYCYKITNVLTNSIYIGMTNNPSERWSRHKSVATSLVRKKKCYTKICKAIREYGVSNFTFEVFAEFKYRDVCSMCEVLSIKDLNESNVESYNIQPGGSVEYTPNYNKTNHLKGISEFIKDKKRFNAHRKQLSKARAGKKPALGMKHSISNKKYFKEVSNKYWDENRVYDSEVVSDILSLSLKEAMDKYKISQTHFYRMRNKHGIKSMSPSEIGTSSWSNRYTYDDDASEIIKLSKKEARDKYGIGGTSYYKLKRKHKSVIKKRLTK